MKKIFFAIIAMMVVLCGQAAYAQNYVTNIAASDLDACGKYLVLHPLDTICSEYDEPVTFRHDTIIGGKLIPACEPILVRRMVYMVDGVVTPVDVYFRTVGLDAGTTRALVLLSKQTRVAEKVHAGHVRDEEYFVIKGLTPNPKDSLKVISKAARKYGPGIAVEGAWNYAPRHYFGFNASAGLIYDWEWVEAEVMGGFARETYSRNAVHAGESYTVGTAQANILVKPFRIDKADQIRLLIGGGVYAKYYGTDSQPVEGSIFNSGGWHFTWNIEPKLILRGWCSGTDLYFKAQIHPETFVIQNQGYEHKLAWSLSMGIKFKFHKSKTGHVYLWRPWHNVR